MEIILKRLDKVVALATICITTVMAITLDSLINNATSETSADNINREYAVSIFTNNN